MNVFDMITCFENINVLDATQKAVSDTVEPLKLLNKSQLTQGVSSTGEIITRKGGKSYPYSKPYAKYKSKLGLQTSVVDLKLKGDFVDAMTVKGNSTEIEFDSDDEKKVFLEDFYTSKIFGLTDENTERYIEQNFEPAFKETISQQSGLDFG